MAKKEKFYGPKDKIRKIIEDATYSLRVNRKELSEKLGVSNRTLHSWITNGYIPWKHHNKMIEFASDKPAQEESSPNGKPPKDLGSYGTGELIDELLRRGIKVSLGG